MAEGEDWTATEVALVVADYLQMFRLFLVGQKFNKAEHLRRLQETLHRSKGSIEFKRANISAVLRDLEMQWLPGYAPRSNYQELLVGEVVHQIAVNPEIDRAAMVDTERPAAAPEDVDFSRIHVDPPKSDLGIRDRMPRAGVAIKLKRDYLAREARNASLGRAGEDFVLKFEEWQLRSRGYAHLANKIEHVALGNDAAGYDILSYEIDGREKFIEVKTTAYAKETPFYISKSEINFAESNEDAYRLYRLFEFRSAPKLFELEGAVGRHCLLDPVSYRASFS